MLQLIGLWDSPFVRRLAVMMRLYDIAFEPVFYSVYRNADALRIINPLLTAPSLVLENGEVMIDSNAIVDYLDELVGRERALTPPSGDARRQVLQIAALASVACDKVGQLYRELEWRPLEVRYQPAIERFRSQIADCCHMLEQRLEQRMAHDGGAWLVGDRMTQADLMVAIAYRFLQYYDASLACLPKTALPRLAQLSTRCEALEAFALTPLD